MVVLDLSVCPICVPQRSDVPLDELRCTGAGAHGQLACCWVRLEGGADVSQRTGNAVSGAREHGHSSSGTRWVVVTGSTSKSKRELTEGKYCFLY